MFPIVANFFVKMFASDGNTNYFCGMNSDLIISDVINGKPLNPEMIEAENLLGVSGCYVIFCDQTMMYYVGSSIDCGKRIQAHLAEIKRGKHTNPNITESLKLYGEKSFHLFLIEKCDNDGLEECERKWYQIIGKNRLYNHTRKITRKQNKTLEIRMKYGVDTKKYAIDCLKRGESYQDVSEKTGIKVEYLRLLIFRDENKISNDVSSISEAKNVVSETHQNISDKGQNSYQNISEQHKKFYKALELEAVFYTTSAAACYGAVMALPGVIGWALAVVYGLLCFNSLQMAKCGDIPATAEHGKNRVWALELAAVFAHYYTVNRALWANLDALPFDVKYVPKGGTWILNNGEKVNGIWQGGEIIFYLSVAVAVLLSAAAIEAVNTRLKLTKEQGK